MANWNPKKQLFAIGGGALTICLAAAGGVYYTQGLVEEIETQIAQKREAIAAAEAKIAKIPALEKDVIILRENLEEYVKILPDTKELNTFTRSLNQFEKQAGLRLIKGTPKAAPSSAKAVGRFTPIEYTYQMTASLWQFLRFINLVENYERFVSITDFNIQSGEKNAKGGEDTREGEVVHTITLTMQTFTYNGQPTGKEVQIPDYEAQREALREEIWDRMQAIRIEKYEHRGQAGRRDILVDPRERGDLRTDGPSQTDQRTLLERYIGELGRLREVQTRMRRQDTTLFEQYALEKALREGMEKVASTMEADGSRLSYAPYRLRWAREVVGPFEEMRTAVASGTIKRQAADRFLPQKEMEALVAEMAADCDSGQLEMAKSRYESVQERLAVPPEDPRHDLAVQAKSYHVKASTALDFKGMDLRIQGVVVTQGGRSGVLLNGDTYEEGEYVSDELLVKRVEEEQVTFVFRGLTLVRTM